MNRPPMTDTRLAELHRINDAYADADCQCTACELLAEVERLRAQIAPVVTNSDRHATTCALLTGFGRRTCTCGHDAPVSMYGRSWDAP